MKEHYLHYLWKHKMLPLHRLKISNGKVFKVINPGLYNTHESGPDFSNAIVEIDGIKWHGSIEMHVNAKDWYTHKHHKDASYNNVILHVVYNGDQKVMQNGWEIPQIELKEIIDNKHFQFYTSVSKPTKSILCASQLKHVPRSIIEALIHERIEQRLFRKNENTKKGIRDSNSEKISLYLLASAMGTKVNKLPFEELATRLCPATLAKQTFRERLLLIQMVSGLHQPKNEGEILLLRKCKAIFSRGEFAVMSSTAWKTKGMRCGDWFDLRMKQFSLLVGILADIDQIIAEPIHQMAKILKNRIGDEIGKTAIELNFSTGIVNHLLINWLVPYIYWKANSSQNANDEYKVSLKDKAYQLLLDLKPDKNEVIEQWKRYGLNVKNACTSQALLENYNEFCIHKKCLTCGIGKNLLS